MEPWLTGKLNDVSPLLAAILYSFEQAREDLRRWTEGLSEEQVWRRTGEIGSVGFHIRHIAGSVDRLITYADGRQLDESQLVELKSEQNNGGLSRDELLALLDEKLSKADTVVRGIDPSSFSTVREIGRKRTPVPLGVLLVHISEHTQRHVGAAIVTSKVVRGPAPV